MSDTITAWHDMQEENKPVNHVAKHNPQYIWLLDFTDGKVYRYDISVLGNEQNGWNPDSESCEAFLIGAGHSVGSCEWMVTTEKTFEHGN
tara:strand:+ start:479 stop:748 length:270 start_codon:yes stop_codon:yes gene_type:complete